MNSIQFGRTKILRDETEVTADNVVKIVSETFLKHRQNNIDIDELYRYYKGNQPILLRQKKIRPEICNKIVENRANEIVSFKTGYLCGEPLQYISRGDSENVTEEIGKLNDLMVLCSKEYLDTEIAEWMYICGQGYRMVLPNGTGIANQIIPKLLSRKMPIMEDESPFSIYTLDPRYTYVVYHSGIGEPPIMSVKYVCHECNSTAHEDGSVTVSVYTPKWYFELTGKSGLSALKLKRTVANTLEFIPIIEYPLNNSRMGAFEIVLPILNAINMVQSNRLDGIEQFIQSLTVLYNADIDKDEVATLRESGFIKIKNYGDQKADIKEISQQLDQQQTQTLIDYMYQTVLNIVGMPNRNGGSSTSDTGTAVIVRDGWSAAEARAKQDETSFKRSELAFLKIVLHIMRGTTETTLKLSDIETKFTRRNYENIQSKAQVLCQMLQNEKIHPQLAFTHSGMFSDPEAAYLLSKKYYNSAKEESIKPEILTDTNVITNSGGGEIA